MSWARVRFKANFDDSRPIIWPPLGPFWESGLSCDGSYAIVVAYFPEEKIDRLKDFWPEARDIESYSIEDKIVFTDRFQCPRYWDEVKVELT